MMLAEALKVIPVKESAVSTDGIGDYMVYNLGRNIAPGLQTLGTKRMLGPEGFAQTGPVVSVIEVRATGSALHLTAWRLLCVPR